MHLEKLARWGYRGLLALFAIGAPLGVIAAVSAIPGCPRMREQSRLKPYEASEFFDDHKSVRQPVPGTVPRGAKVTDPQFYYGLQTMPEPVQAAPAGTPGAERPSAQQPKAPPATLEGVATQPDYVTEIPVPVTEIMLDRGRDQYEVNCSPCHGLAGYGNGVVTHAGYPKPPSYHTKRLRQASAGYLFDVITNGFGQMYSYGSRLTPEERWATIAYIRALQLSQSAPVDLLEADDLDQLEEADP